MTICFFPRHIDRLAFAILWLAGLLPRAIAAQWRPSAEALKSSTTEAMPARLLRMSARLRRWAYGPKTDWP